MDYRDILGFSKKQKPKKKVAKSSKPTITEKLANEFGPLNEWSKKHTGPKRWSKSVNGSSGLTEFERKGGKDNINEVDFSKVKLPANVERFLNRFVDAMKGANLNRMKRSAVLYQVIEASGMSPQQLMSDIQKIKKAMK